ncbi:group II intron reverse transcriptase/maturase [Salininema proteolyticum]|uniref:RNA-directed DNA polymerase n=1 Tax=Salininema proteolyticum TaxID=1607685 RepID=A0ABV8TVV8_9ACTN
MSREEVWAAWLAVARNGGAAGADGVGIDDFGRDAKTLQGGLYKIWNRMASGSYFPKPVRSVSIPKPAGSGRRVLGIPVVADRIAQTVVAKRVEEVVEPLFHSDSYGFRPGRSAKEAVKVCRDRCWSRSWVVDVDIASFFDEVDWNLLVKAVEALGLPSWVVLYVRRWLACEVIDADGDVAPRERGLAQGGPVSPVLANLFLHWALDSWLERAHPMVMFERYADDVVIHCVSQRQAEKVLASLEVRMTEVGLRLHPEKTRIVYCGNDRDVRWSGPRSFTFLGFDFRCRPGGWRRDGERMTTFSPAVSRAARKRMSQVMRSWRIGRRTDRGFDEIARLVNPIVRGWMNYYGSFGRSELYPLLGQLNAMLAKWVRKKYRRFRSWKRFIRRWCQVVEEYPAYFEHWRWVTRMAR